MIGGYQTPELRYSKFGFSCVYAFKGFIMFSAFLSLLSDRLIFGNKTYVLILALLPLSVFGAVPTITSTEITSATEDNLYTYSLTATDADNHTLTWAVTTGTTLPSWLSISQGASSADTIGDPMTASIGGVSSDAAGNVYVVVGNLGKVFRIQPDGTTSEFATVSIAGSSYGALVVGDFLYITEYGASKVSRLDLTNPSAGVTDFVSIPSPLGIVAKDGFLYVSTYSNNTVEKIEIADSSNKTTFISGASNAWGLGFSSAGEMYVTDWNSRTIKRYDTSQALDNTFTTITTTGSPADVKVDANDNLYVALYAGNLSGGVTKYLNNTSTPIVISTGNDPLSMSITTTGTLLWGTYTPESGTSNYYVRQLNTGAVLSGTPTNAEVGLHSVSVSVTDTASNTASQSFTVTVTNTNDAPLFSSDVNLPTVAVNATSPTGSTIDSLLSSGFSDIDPVEASGGNGGYSYTGVAISANSANSTTEGQWQYSLDSSTWVNMPTVSSTAGLLLSKATQLRFVPVANYSGTAGSLTAHPLDDSVSTTFTTGTQQTLNITAQNATTGVVGQTGRSISVSVLSPNVDPTLTNAPSSITVAEDTASSVDLSAATFADADSGNNAVTFKITASAGTLFATGANSVTVAGNATAALTLSGTVANIDTFLNTGSNIQYIGASNSVGTDVAALALVGNDGGNSGSGGGSDVSFGSVSVNINNVNDAPTISGTPGITVAEDSAYSFTPTGADIDTGDTLTYSIINKPSWASFSTTTGVLTGTPGDSGVGTTSGIVITVTDAASASANLTAFNLTVTNINDVPTGSVTISGDAIENETLTANNTLADADGLGTLAYQWKRDGSVITGATNSTYIALTADIGASISVTVSYTDNQGGNESVSSLGVTIVSANAAPIITEGTTTAVTLSEDNAPTAFDLTLNATDADNDTLTWSISTAATQGTATASGTGLSKAITYSANTNVNGADSFVVTVSDGNGGEDTITVNITITPVNDTVTGNVTITGNPVEIQTLTAVTSALADVDGLGTFNYQWQRAGAAIDSATSMQYSTTTVDVGSSLTVVVSYVDAQGSSESVTSSGFGPIKADLDRDGIADDDDSDTDGDGMPDAFETANGLDPRDSSDAGSDLDGDGISNLQEFIDSLNPTIDDVAPVFGTLEPIIVDATGLFTSPTLEAPIAVDGKDGDVTATRTSSPLKPGEHEITWTATDAAGNKATAQQQLHINPIVNVEIDQQAEEGGTVEVRVVLNGDAPTYPVVVNYEVSGTADETDHDARSGTINITSGLEGSITFDLLSDSLSGEAGETIIFTLGSIEHGVAGHNTVHTVTVIEDNVAPTATLNVTQANTPRLLIERTAGLVTVSASVIDPNPNDTHQYDWSRSSNSLVDTDDSSSTFTFDPANLTSGIYTLNVKISDNGSPVQSVEADIAANVLAAPVVLADNTDSDLDGINDTVEGAGDTDGDGIPDHLDAIKVSNVMQTKSSTQDAFLMETNPGLSLRLGVTAFNAGIHVAGLDEAAFADNAEAGTTDRGYTHYSQIFDFEVRGLANNGTTIDVVLPLNQALPSNAVYRKFDEQTGWYDFVENANNTLKSAPGTEGFCPSVGDNSYTAGLTAGHYCLLVSIEDGGPNDADKLANGEVIDPGVIAVVIDPTTFEVSGGGSGGSLGWPLLALLFFVSVVVRQRPKRLLRQLSLVGILIVASFTATAEPYVQSASLQSLYITANAGLADTDTSKSQLQNHLANEGIEAVVGSVDTERWGWGLGVGYDVGNGLAFEVGYQDLQEVDFTFSSIDTVNNVADIHPDSGEGMQLSAVYRYWITDQWNVQVRGGAFFWDADYDVKQANGTTVGKDKDSGVDPAWGVGGAYKISSQFAVSGEFRRYEFDNAKTDFYTLGVMWWPWGE